MVFVPIRTAQQTFVLQKKVQKETIRNNSRFSREARARRTLYCNFPNSVSFLLPFLDQSNSPTVEKKKDPSPPWIFFCTH